MKWQTFTDTSFFRFSLKRPPSYFFSQEKAFCKHHGSSFRGFGFCEAQGFFLKCFPAVDLKRFDFLSLKWSADVDRSRVGFLVGASRSETRLY